MIKIVNIYIVCDLDVWPTNSIKDLKFRHYLFDTTNIVKSDEENLIYIVPREYHQTTKFHGILRMTLMKML